MKYFEQVYTNAYDILVDTTSWFMYIVICVLVVVAICIFQTEKLNHRGVVTYYSILFLVCWFVIKILLWIFAPTPELLFK